MDATVNDARQVIAEAAPAGATGVLFIYTLFIYAILMMPSPTLDVGGRPFLDRATRSRRKNRSKDDMRPSHFIERTVQAGACAAAILIHGPAVAAPTGGDVA